MPILVQFKIWISGNGLRRELPAPNENSVDMVGYLYNDVVRALSLCAVKLAAGHPRIISRNVGTRCEWAKRPAY